MHPKLGLDNLERLPLPIREVAESACGPHRSWEHVAAMQIALSRVPNIDRTAFYPVCYTNLDTARIPTIDQLESFSPETETTVMSAAMALDTILQLRPAADVARAMWPRIWEYFSWLHTYRDYFPETTFKLPQPSTLFLNFLLFTNRLGADSDFYDSLAVAGGFAGMITKAWSFLDEVEVTPDVRDAALYGLCRFMLSFTHGTDEVADLIEGAGGSMRDLGKLVLRYLHGAIHQPPAPLTDIHVFRIRTILDFLHKVDFHPDAHRWYWNLPLGPLCKDLLYQDFVESLVDTTLCVIQSPSADTADTLKDCFILLGRILTTCPGYLWLPEAIEKGLFRIIVVCECISCDSDDRDIFREHLKILLQRVLPGNLVYYYVLLKLKDALDELIFPEAFCESPLFETWAQFLPLATAQIQLLESFLSDFIVQRACDNAQCGYIGDKADFQRCSGCQAFYYCSQACQLVGLADRAAP
ncbi:hypothetical protein FB451DRAFT_172552 [Mycena latifolia]|nr:hypothetical protein FB451DRAFT_172552 [Mycena latifolia]